MTDTANLDLASAPGVRDAAPATVALRGVVKDYSGHRALDEFTLDLAPGEFVALLGPSGCGKTTALRALAGLEAVDGGAIEIDGADVSGLPTNKRDIGMVFQAYSLYPWQTVEENIAFGLECSRVPKDQHAERIAELIGIMGLAEFADRHPHELSGGMRQRVAIARALAPAPDVLLLDEPFGALDAQTKRAMQDFLLTIWQRTGATILMVTHDVEESIYLSQRIYVLTSRPGRVGSVIDVPFGRDRGPEVKRDARFLDLRDEIEHLLVAPDPAMADA